MRNYPYRFLCLLLGLIISFDPITARVFTPARTPSPFSIPAVTMFENQALSAACVAAYARSVVPVAASLRRKAAGLLARDWRAPYEKYIAPYYQELAAAGLIIAVLWKQLHPLSLSGHATLL
ncbi:MAG TPA: hypothetical protein VMU17_01940, partial [Elusimicrobiota bacterium]|nr:hypothetical protein [Elusimicrobiota bacterium]